MGARFAINIYSSGRGLEQTDLSSVSLFCKERTREDAMSAGKAKSRFTHYGVAENVPCPDGSLAQKQLLMQS